ncbi:MAG: LiaI-LiaF-like domain-containing protein [Candidatus Dormibacteraceae bacterium]
MITVRGYRSYFWPAVLILVGVVAFLVNSGVISTDRLSLLFDLWPVILIVIGLELLARRALPGQNGDVAAVLIVLLAAGGAVAYIALAPNPTTSGKLDSHAALGSLNQAALEIDAGAANVTVTGTSSLEGDLYHATISYSGPKPEISLDRSNGSLTISQGNAGFGLFQTRRFTMDLQINSSIPWAITSNGGASTETFNLGAVTLKSMDINTGASRENITLGAPTSAVAITINGGALTVNLHRSQGTGASVSVSGGAVSLIFDGRQHHAIGSAEDSSGSGADIYRVEVRGGACTVTMDTAASTG